MKMKIFAISFPLLTLAIACLLNVLIDAGCATKPTHKTSTLKLEGLDGAAGKYYDAPILY